MEKVVNGTLSIRKAAEEYNLKASTLQHRLEKKKNLGKGCNTIYSSKYAAHQVFSNECEALLNGYIINCSKMHYGLTLQHLQKLAYEYAKRIKCKYPTSWDINQEAGVDWTKGIWSFNSLGFSEDEFAPSTTFNNTTESNDNEIPNLDRENVTPPPSTSKLITSPIDVDENKISSQCFLKDITPPVVVITPDIVRPYPKAKPKITNRKGRLPEKSRIFTDTPERERLRELHGIKERKQQIKTQKERLKKIKETSKHISELESSSTAVTKRVKKLPYSLEDSSSNSEIDYQSMNSSSDAFSLDDDTIIDIQDITKPESEELKEGDFLLVKFAKKKSVVYYVGKLDSIQNLTEFQVSYLRKKPSSWTFVYPNVPDMAIVDLPDIVAKLPAPKESRGTERSASLFTFLVNFSSHNVN